MLFLSPKKEVMLERNEWHSDSFGSTDEISLFLIWIRLLHFTYGLVSLGAELALLESGVGVWATMAVVMSFFALTFFLLERLMLGVF